MLDKKEVNLIVDLVIWLMSSASGEKKSITLRNKLFELEITRAHGLRSYLLNKKTMSGVRLVIEEILLVVLK